MTRVHFTTLGGLSIALDGQEVSVPTRKASALLVFLALEGKHGRSRARLADLLWSRSGGDQARQSLRQALFAVRKSLDGLDPFDIDDDQICIRTDLVSCDATEFMEAAAHPERLERARELYKGELLEGFEVDEPPFDQWLSSRRTEIREAAIQIYTAVLDAQYAAGETAEGIRTGLTLLELDPLNEEAHRKLMRLYFQQGRVNEALRVYRDLVERLRQQMRLDPQPETTRVHDEIMSGRQQTETSPEARKLCVLVVEDNDLQRKLIARILLDDGYGVVTVDNGADALLEIGRSICDLVLLDINLPMMDGLNILETVKRREVPTPVILVSAEPPEKVEARALSLGAADFIQKPVRKDVLLARIERALAAVQK